MPVNDASTPLPIAFVPVSLVAQAQAVHYLNVATVAVSIQIAYMSDV
jgi:hypothetical protein